MSTRKITRESEEKKGSTFEGIIGLLLIGAFIWGGVTLFSESEPQYGYHRDEQIDYIIHAYNQVAENKLGEVSDSSQVTFGTGEAAVNIASPEDRVMFKIWREAEPEQALASVLKTADLFAKIVSPELTNEDLTVIHEALLTGKHNYYNMFDYKGVGYALIWRDVNGGLREYSFDLYADEINFEDTES